MLADSNIVIYSIMPEHVDLRGFIEIHAPAVSAITLVEVLGFHRLTTEEREKFEKFFASTTLLPLSDPVLEQAVKLRQAKKMTLGDALIAATALVHNHTLITRNTKDFEWITGLTLVNPFES
jgi:predicted nucleic acid-binding protein